MFDACKANLDFMLFVSVLESRKDRQKKETTYFRKQSLIFQLEFFISYFDSAK
jgi:hypothetical protein